MTEHETQTVDSQPEETLRNLYEDYAPAVQDIVESIKDLPQSTVSDAGTEVMEAERILDDILDDQIAALEITQGEVTELLATHGVSERELEEGELFLPDDDLTALRALYVQCAKYEHRIECLEYALQGLSGFQLGDFEVAGADALEQSLETEKTNTDVEWLEGTDHEWCLAESDDEDESDDENEEAADR